MIRLGDLGIKYNINCGPIFGDHDFGLDQDKTRRFGQKDEVV